MLSWMIMMALESTLTLGIGLGEAPKDQGDHLKGKDKPAPTLPSCPVMGEPVNFGVSVPTDDGPVFFCCPKCIPKYQANPTKYAAQVAAQRRALVDRPKIQVTCPVSGEPVVQDAFVKHHGQKVFFCCKDCIKKFERSPKKYRVSLANSYTYQTQCPVTGEEIDPEVFASLDDGRKVYFCCPRCAKKLFANPSKYLPNLEAQGFAFTPKELTPSPQGDVTDHGAEAHEEHEREHHHEHDDNK